MATAFVQSKSTSTTGVTATTVAATFTSNVASGNLIAVFVVSGTSNSATVSDSLNNTYTAVDSTNFSGDTTQTFYAKNISGGANTVTATWSVAVGYRLIVIHEISGADTTAPLDKNAINGQTAPGLGTDAVTSGSVTTVGDGQYIFGGTRIDNTVTRTINPGTNYTGREAGNGGADEAPFRSEDRIQATAGAIAATFTQASGSAQNFTTAIMTFKPAAAAGSVVTPRSLALLGVGT